MESTTQLICCHLSVLAAKSGRFGRFLKTKGWSGEIVTRVEFLKLKRASVA